MEFHVKSALGMWDVARAALEKLASSAAGDGERGAAVLALSGELGAGKTTFTQALAGVLGATGPVQSPTYVIVKKHALADSSPWRTLVHMDAYRLRSADDLAALGWEDALGDASNLIVIEWPERVEGAIPARALKLNFAHDTPETRVVTLE